MRNIRLIISAVLLGIAIAFGGGGTPSPGTELVVELSAIVLFAGWVIFARHGDVDQHRPSDWPLLGMAALFVAIPALQLFPLPPAIWRNLPGREIEVQSLALIGRAEAWMPWSETPTRTLASLLSLIAPLVMLVMVARLSRRDRSALLGVLGSLGLLSALVGTIQLASGHANWLRFYSITQYGFATGFQANRNAEADVLLIAAMALAAWAFPQRSIAQSRQWQVLVVAVIGFLCLSVVLTGSRTGVALLLVVAAFCAMIALPGVEFRRPRNVAIALFVALLACSAGYALRGNARIESTLTRFDNDEVVRPEIWQDTLYAIDEHWPAGSGIGSFQPVFAAAERLEYVRPRYPNRAHEDYLEFVLEAGIFAPFFLIAALAFAGYRLWRILREHQGLERRAQGLFVLGSLLVLVLHSLVDYPMRTMSLAVVAGVMAGQLARSGPRKIGRHGDLSKGVGV